jgi:hypothetical protein
MRLWLRRRPLLAKAVLLLLAIAVLVQPVLAGVGELHAVEHGTHEATAHDDDHAPHEEDDPAHALGAHALLHQAASAGASDVFPCALPMPAFLLLTVDLPGADVLGAPKAVITLPFRPPIA